MNITVRHENKTEGLWIVERPIHVTLTNGKRIVIPKGFITDFASVPRIFWSVIPPVGKYCGAAVVHDYLYSKHQFPREFCDKQFYKLCLKEDNWHIRSAVMYIAVRLFGWLYY